MKKFFIGALAVVAMVSCAKEEVLRQQAPNSIAFNNFVENSVVRNSQDAGDPSFITADLTAFDVWGFMDKNSGVVFEKERVTRSGDDWTYVNTQYWTENHKYWFAALAPVDNANIELALAADPYMVEAGLGMLTFTNIEGTDDVIYAEATATTGAEITSENPGKVSLAFNHLLSKVRFSFKNCMTNDNAYLAVENIKMTVPGKGSIDLTQDTYTWTLDKSAADATLDLGSMNKGEHIARNNKGYSDNHRLTIPASSNESYIVTFKVSLYNGDQLAGEWEKSTTITGCELVAGKKYNFSAELNADNIADNPLKPIEFTASVIEWEDPEVEYNGGAIDTESRTVVSTLAELQAALDNATEDVDILLANKIEGNVTATQKAGVNVQIDGAGNEFDGTIYVHGDARMNGEETLTIKNVAFVTEVAARDFISSNTTASKERYAHNILVQDCTFTATGAAENTAVALRIRQGNNIKFVAVTARGLHSLIQSNGSAGVNVERTNINGKNGISLSGASKGAVVSKTTIVSNVAYSYGVRIDGANANELSVSDCDITAGAPVLVRKATGECTVNLAGNTLTTPEAYQVIVCSNDYEDGVTLVDPTGNVVLNGADGYVVFK